jgi:peroxiredoxin
MISRWPKRIGLGAGFLAVLCALVFFFAPYIASYTAKVEERVKIGEQVPDLAATGEDGKAHKLSDFRGKVVVLEWMSPVCEFTAKHYDSGNMQALQRDVTAGGAIWLSVNSNAKGAEGHLTPELALKRLAESKSSPTHLLIDEDGSIGRAFGARSTPSVAVLDATGALRYKGAIDDKPWGNGNPAKAKNYVTAALKELGGGQAISTATTMSYGCGIKY